MKPFVPEIKQLYEANDFASQSESRSPHIQAKGGRQQPQCDALAS